MNVLVLGATRGIGRALARRLAERGDRLFLLGRDAEDLGRCARDLEIRARQAMPVPCAVCDLERPETFEPALAAALAALGSVEAVVVTAGLFGAMAALFQHVGLSAMAVRSRRAGGCFASAASVLARVTAR